MNRLDQVDYELLGVKDCWYVGETLNMLTSYEMDLKGYFVNEDRINIFEKISKKYWTYITGLMLEGFLPYVTHHVPEDVLIFEEGDDLDKCIKEFSTSFSKEDLMKCIINGNKLSINIENINKLLSGEIISEIIILPEILTNELVYEKVKGVPKQVSTVVETPIKDKSEGKQEEETSEKMSLMWKYAFEIGVFCKENANDDYIPIFDDVTNYMALKYGADTVPDSWIREILAYAPKELSKSDGRPRKVLTDAIKTGFYMRDWYNEKEKLSELEFNQQFKKYLSRVSVNVRSKSWEYLNKFISEGK